MSLYRTERDKIPEVPLTDKVIILDLDSTLVCTQEDVSSLSKLKIMSDPSLMELRRRVYYFELDDLKGPGSGSVDPMWGITRPHTEEFLLFCFSYFKVVAVWSAGKKPYVEAIVDIIFRDVRPPHIVFTYDDIDTDEGGVVKNLEKMISENPVANKYMNLKNSLALDDNPNTFKLNIDNGILIPPYEPGPTIRSLNRDDNALLQLKYWLLQPEVISSTNVTNLDKSKIFTTSLEKYRKSLGNRPGNKMI